MWELLLSTCLNAELLYQQSEATSFLTVSTAEQITELYEDPKIVSINSNIHYTDAHKKNPPQISVMHNSSSNIHKLGDRDLLISLQAPLKIFGLGYSENTGFWGVQFPAINMFL